MNLIRNTKLIPKWLQIRFDNNKLSIDYSIKDNLTNKIIGNTYINFTPSEELMQMLKKEITLAIKKK